jgi:hypothetical protein
MADRNRRFALAVIALPFLFLLMSGLASANSIFVNTTDGESDPFPLCTLPDAVAAHNSHLALNGCAGGSGNDAIFILVTGKILIDESLEITSGSLEIDGPIFGCSGPGPCGITIDGGGTVQIIRADAGTSLFLNSLTLANGFATTTLVTNTGGGAIYAEGTDLEIHDCLLRDNQAAGSISSVGGLGGAIYGDDGTIVIVNSTFANNTAVAGTSICATSGPATVCDTVVPGAPSISSISEGGAIFDLDATIKITNSTIANNSAQDGGGLAQSGGSPIAPIKGTIFQSNAGGNCGGVIAGDIGFNISSDGTCPFPQVTSLNNTNSLLIPLANNGGPTETFALETFPLTSPAINLIPVASCTDQQAVPQPLGTDQRLFGRPDPGNPNTCDSGAYEDDAVAPFTLNSERVQIARSTSPNSDKVNIGLTFTENGDPDCDLDDDALRGGIGVELFAGTCANVPFLGLDLELSPFVVHTINGQSYGTLFQVNGPETVSARMVAFPRPANTCGKWTLNLEVAGLNTPSLGLGGTNPFALVLFDPNGDGAGCFDITNAIVGNQIPKPTHGVRRGTRR